MPIPTLIVHDCWCWCVHLSRLPWWSSFDHHARLVLYDCTLILKY